MLLPKPKNWRQINAIREDFWKAVFDDVNGAFDAISRDTQILVDNKRKDLQNLLLKKAKLYKADKELKGKS